MGRGRGDLWREWFLHHDHEGVTYTAQASTDMENWTTEGVTITSPDADGNRTATVAAGTGIPARFIRLLVGY